MLENIPKQILDLVYKTEKKLVEPFFYLDQLSFTNHQKVLAAFSKNKVSEYHLRGTTGYGYHDQGRQVVEQVFADLFKAEGALVRNQIVSGTHAIALCLFGVLRPGDHLLAATGEPYDTLHDVIGINGPVSGSLVDFGIEYSQVPLDAAGKPDIKQIVLSIKPNTRMVYIQRSRGYAWRPSLTIEQISEVIKAVKNVNEQIIIFVDNCYGELVEEFEPTEVGADLIAGSLIKNLGGSIAPTGGYVVGNKDLIELAATRWTAPGIGDAVGSTFHFNSAFLQGLYLAPKTVAEAIKGAIFASAIFDELGFETSPSPVEKRTDLIQAVKLRDPELMVAFCRGLQKASPIDGHVRPEPAPMPGYSDQVIMAGGTFVQGATMEMSADGPIREPYIVYFQGGVSYNYIKIGILSAIKEMLPIIGKNN